MLIIPKEVIAYYAKHPLMKRMYLTDIGYFPHAKHHYRERKEGIEEYIFLYCTAGKGTVVIDGNTFHMEQHEALCIPHFKKHHYYANDEEPWSLLWVHINGEDTSNYPLEDLRLIHLKSEHMADRVQFLFDLLYQVLNIDYTEGNFIYISQVLHLILSEIYYRDNSSGKYLHNRHVTKIIRFMHENLDQNLTLEMITTEFRLSKGYLNTIFKKYAKKSPMDFFIHLKMRHASSLLRTTDLHINEIAFRLGYEDPYYFSRIFKKIVGTSPKTYRDNGYVDYRG